MPRLARTTFITGAAALLVLASALVAEPALAASPSAPHPSWAQGFDVSTGTASDIDAGVKAGAKFVFIKAIETDDKLGNISNPDFAALWKEAGAKGISHGAYAVADMGDGKGNWASSHQGGTDFVNKVKSSMAGKAYVLPPVIDLEAGATTTCWVTTDAKWNKSLAVNQKLMVTWIKTYIQMVTSGLGRTPIVYTSQSWWKTCTGNSSAIAPLAKLWVANYNTSPGSPAMPGGWGAWTFWQWNGGTATGTGTFPGDQDVLDTTVAGLNQYVTPFASTPTPTISGTAKTGRVLTFANLSSWQSNAASLSWTWYQNGSAISGSADKASITMTGAQYNHTISLKVTAKKSGYVTTTKASAATGKVVASGLTVGKPVITGTAQVGHQLLISTGTWTAGTKFAYQWYSNGAAIKGATTSHFTPSASYAGKKITAKVTGSQTGYTTASAMTNTRGPLLP